MVIIGQLYPMCKTCTRMGDASVIGPSSESCDCVLCVKGLTVDRVSDVAVMLSAHLLKAVFMKYEV